MKAENILYTKSLKEQVYEYLREQMREQKIQAGSAINMDATSRKLGISKTPLRDALIQLEMEGFVSILPRKGIYVNGLTIDEIKEFYQVIGALESAAIAIAFGQIKPVHIEKMKKLILEMHAAIEKNNFGLYSKKNLAFHNIYIDLCGNHSLKKIVDNLKKRLYDFQAQSQWVKEWELTSMKEHQQLVDNLEAGNLEMTQRVIRDIHWSFEVQEVFIRKYYFSQSASTTS